MARAIEPSVWVQGHEDAKMFFTVDGMANLLVKFARFGQRPVRVDFLPTAGGADAPVNYLLEQIDSDSGGSPTIER